MDDLGAQGYRVLSSGTPSSRHVHVRRMAPASDSRSLEWQGPPAPSNWSSEDPGEEVGRVQPYVEAERSAPDVGTALQVHGELAGEANEQYPLLEQPARGSTNLAEWLAGADMPPRASFQEPPTGVFVHVYSQGTCLGGGLTQSAYIYMRHMHVFTPSAGAREKLVLSGSTVCMLDHTRDLPYSS